MKLVDFSVTNFRSITKAHCIALIVFAMVSDKIANKNKFEVAWEQFMEKDYNAFRDKLRSNSGLNDIIWKMTV